MDPCIKSQIMSRHKITCKTTAKMSPVRFAGDPLCRVWDTLWSWRDICHIIARITFSALILLVGHQEQHPACKKLSAEVLVWLSVRSEVQIV